MMTMRRLIIWAITIAGFAGVILGGRVLLGAGMGPNWLGIVVGSAILFAGAALVNVKRVLK